VTPVGRRSEGRERGPRSFLSAAEGGGERRGDAARNRRLIGSLDEGECTSASRHADTHTHAIVIATPLPSPTPPLIVRRALSSLSLSLTRTRIKGRDKKAKPEQLASALPPNPAGPNPARGAIDRGSAHRLPVNCAGVEAPKAPAVAEQPPKQKTRQNEGWWDSPSRSRARRGRPNGVRPAAALCQVKSRRPTAKMGRRMMRTRGTFWRRARSLT
jgi:hypothetical protein